MTFSRCKENMANLFAKAWALLVFPFFLVVASASCKAQSARVQVQETTINIPTYLLGPEDPNPPFKLVNANAVYPYTMLDNLTDHREIKAYRAIVVENEYLRATILPELGGRLYSLYDKAANREVFYRNGTVKYGLVGLRGAWISGGIEFNFPNGHTTDTVSQVSAHYQKNSDGSATVVVGDVDQVSEMYWQVALTLRPGQARLEQQITLFNPTPVENLYWYWNNAAVPATDDSQFVYPMREVTPDSRTEVWTYPTWKGVDYSQYKNIRNATEIFGLQVRRDWFGAYYTQSNYGVVHVADYRDVPGRKIWTWGTAGDGTIWTRLLTDSSGPYNEIQSGRFLTQLNRDLMPPHQVASWTEYWYPVQQLASGFVEATKQFTINVDFGSTTKKNGQITVSVSPTENITGATLTVGLQGKVLKAITELSFEPLKTRAFSIPVDDIEAAKGHAEVELADRFGHKLLDWSAAEPIDGNPDFVPGLKVQQEVSGDNSVQELFLRGELLEKEGQQEDADRLFDEIQRRDPNYIPVLRKMAMRYYRAAEFTLARDSIERAVRLNDADAETQYIAGIVYRATGQLASTEAALGASVRLVTSSPQALAQLGEISLSQKDYPRAEEFLRRALSYDPNDPLIESDLAAALRLSHKRSEAVRIEADATAAAPLYPLARAEQWRLSEATPNAARPAHQMWTQTVGNRMQSYLEAGAWYWRLNDLESSNFILNAAVQAFPEREVSPMIYYYLASNARREGQPQRAQEYARKAQAAPYEKLFPNRLCDVAVLQEALQADSKDAHAQYLLGNFLFQYGRYDEAERLWQSAEASGFHYSVLYRNLGLYEWRVKHKLDEAATLYAKAVENAPRDFHLYVDLDAIYAQAGATQERERLFARAPAEVLDQDPARSRYIVLLIEQGHFEKALSLLSNHNFKPWELGEDARAIFVFANIEEGRQALTANDFKRAQECFDRAFEYPPNLGVGMPDKTDDAAALYWSGAVLQKQGNLQDASRAWKKLADQTGGRRLSQYYQALALEALGQGNQATDKLTELTNGSGGATNYYVAGLAELHRKRSQQARADFQKALEINPLFWQAQVELNRMSS
jgi:tetratricopeptide (TPR) repeat protein